MTVASSSSADFVAVIIIPRAQLGELGKLIMEWNWHRAYYLCYDDIIN